MAGMPVHGGATPARPRMGPADGRARVCGVHHARPAKPGRSYPRVPALGTRRGIRAMLQSPRIPERFEAETNRSSRAQAGKPYKSDRKCERGTGSGGLARAAKTVAERFRNGSILEPFPLYKNS